MPPVRRCCCRGCPLLPRVSRAPHRIEHACAHADWHVTNPRNGGAWVMARVLGAEPCAKCEHGRAEREGRVRWNGLLADIGGLRDL
jgi:hypothetical protein